MSGRFAAQTDEGQPAQAACPCFTLGSRIATSHGEIAVEQLRIGDRVMTRDNGLQEIRWIGRRAFGPGALQANRHLVPVRISKGSLGNDLPEHDMVVSPNHRILVSREKTVLHFDAPEVLVAAKHLTGIAGVKPQQGVPVCYVHLMFDRHQVLLSDGVWSESFQPEAAVLAGMGNAQRIEILSLFPDLAKAEGIAAYGAARPIGQLRAAE